ncbi:hypothetical protein LTR70_001218 [Exophiala xenobiotica]|uniref:Uncharacterized protein n=1 Tax=Lithohypha guttulata TaxID=1690604 RepID=A0ABR0KKF9_9EURO|nr:hypothetical protein LTR24_001469 [Lithohypha guttulata]KAK5328193.1 hypothetical protein LTR70_001218 [Exophiala xenobiotica]
MSSLASAPNNIRVWAESNNGAPRFISETNMRKLTSFFPAVKRALLAHRASGGGYIEDVILPSRSLAAYKKIMGWIRESYIHGSVVPFRKVEHHAMTTYKQLQSIARDMGIGRLMKLMNAWIRAMLTPKAS